VGLLRGERDLVNRVLRVLVDSQTIIEQIPATP
jgi:hypothetical protein